VVPATVRVAQLASAGGPPPAITAQRPEDFRLALRRPRWVTVARIPILAEPRPIRGERVVVP